MNSISEKPCNLFQLDFVILGAQKAATTTLAYHFQNHSEVSFSNPKEPNFFNWKKDSDLLWYQSLFRGNGLKGEGSVDYSYRTALLKTHLHIYEHNPNAKFIYVLRHPIERMISHYTYNYHRGLVEKDVVLWELESKLEYIQRSRYYTELKPFFDTFPRKQFLFVHFEDFIVCPQDVFDKCCGFLGISKKKINSITLNKSKDNLAYRSINQKKLLLSKYLHPIAKRIPVRVKDVFKERVYKKLERPDLSEDLTSYLYTLLESDIEAIQNYTGEDLKHWYIYNGKSYLQ